MKKEQIVDILKREATHLHNAYGVKRIALFGSFACDNANDKSDVDLIIEFDRPVGFRFFALSDYLEKVLGRKVDILTPDTLTGIRVPSVAENIKGTMFYVS
jgi:hypothetical protein